MVSGIKVWMGIVFTFIAIAGSVLWNNSVQQHKASEVVLLEKLEDVKATVQEEMDCAKSSIKSFHYQLKEVTNRFADSVNLDNQMHIQEENDR